MKRINRKNEITEGAALLAEQEIIVVCKHCGNQIDQSKLIGLSLICPLCGKPQNGHRINPLQDPLTVMCKHCGKKIEQVKLRGLSLICPLCGKPQNGQSHLKASSQFIGFPIII